MNDSTRMNTLLPRYCLDGYLLLMGCMCLCINSLTTIAYLPQLKFLWWTLQQSICVKVHQCDQLNVELSVTKRVHCNAVWSVVTIYYYIISTCELIVFIINPLTSGDILPASGNLSYNAIVGEHHLWPQRVIPYEIDYSLQGLSGLIERAIEDYHQKTCLR